MTSNSEELSRKLGKPYPSAQLVKDTCSNAWNLRAEIDSITQLESYDDANFHIVAAFEGTCDEYTALSQEPAEYLLKLYNSVESNNFEMLEGVSQLLKSVSSYSGSSVFRSFNHPIVPVPIATAVKFRSQLENARRVSADVGFPNESIEYGDNLNDVAYSNICPRADGTVNDRIAARLFHWIHGPTLNKAGEVTAATPTLIANVGYALGSITNSLRNFDHAAFHRYHSWDLQNFESVAGTFSHYIEEPDIQMLVEFVLESFCKEVLPMSPVFRKSIIMGDCNDANVIINTQKTAVVGIIDFGDAVYTWSINEVAIALAYSLLTEYGRSEPLRNISCLFGGYTYAVGKCVDRVDSLGEASSPSSEGSGCSLTKEVPHLHTLICARLCTSIMIGAYSISKDPANEYLKLHAHPAKEALRAMLRGLCARTETGTDTGARSTPDLAEAVPPSSGHGHGPGAQAASSHALDPSSLLRLFTRVSEETMALGPGQDGASLTSLFTQIATDHKLG